LEACRRVVRGCGMREFTASVGAITLVEKRLAYGLLVRIMTKRA
jgi:hypothetical protein